MRYSVARHDVGHPYYERAARKFEAEREESIAGVERNPAILSAELGVVLGHAKMRLAMDPEAGYLETWEEWTTAMQLAGAIFAVSAASKGSDVPCVIDKKTRNLRGTGIRPFTSPGNWLTAFYLAVSCRDQERQRALCEIPLEALRESQARGGGVHGGHLFPWISALQAFVLNRSGLFEDLDRAVELADPRKQPGGDLERLFLPQVAVFRAFAANDSEAFNAALARGVELFKEHYTANEEMAKDVDGTCPLGLLAFACWGNDRSVHHPEFTLEVESGYLPKFIVNGAWNGEFSI